MLISIWDLQQLLIWINRENKKEEIPGQENSGERACEKTNIMFSLCSRISGRKATWMHDVTQSTTLSIGKAATSDSPSPTLQIKYTGK